MLYYIKVYSFFDYYFILKIHNILFQLSLNLLWLRKPIFKISNKLMKQLSNWDGENKTKILLSIPVVHTIL